MKIIELKQNTKAWYDWRGLGIGASEAPTIMGVSPWETIFELWLYKTKQAVKPPMNPFAVEAMRRGQELEPKARTWYEKTTGIIMPPIATESTMYPFLRASLDGANLDLRKGLEIKCPGKVSHAKTLSSQKIPENYLPQIQMQMLVTGFPTFDYVSYSGTDEGPNIIITIASDVVYQEELLPRLIQFWKNVIDLTPPQIQHSDYVKTVERAQGYEDLLRNQNKILDLIKLHAPGATEQAVVAKKRVSKKKSVNGDEMIKVS